MPLRLVASKNEYLDKSEESFAAYLREENRLVNRAKRLGKTLYKVIDCLVSSQITSRIEDFRDSRPKTNFSKPKITRLILATKYYFPEETSFLATDTKIVYPRHLAGEKIKLSITPVELARFKPGLFKGPTWLHARLDTDHPIRGEVDASVGLDFLSEVYEDLLKSNPSPINIGEEDRNLLYITLDLCSMFAFRDINGDRTLWIKNLIIRNPKTRKRFYCRATAR